MKKKTVMYGNGLYARLIHQKIIEAGSLEIVAFTADWQFMTGDAFRGLPLVPFHEVDKIYPPEEFTMLVALAYSRMRDREVMFNKAKAKGYSLENFTARGAVVPSDLIMGENNIISEGVTLAPFGRLGNNNYIGLSTCIGHDCNIRDYTYIAPGCAIGGECEIENLSFIGIGSIIVDSVVVGRETLIGAGSLVLKSTEPYSKYVGSPAKKVAEHSGTGIVIGGKESAEVGPYGLSVVRRS